MNFRPEEVKRIRELLAEVDDDEEGVDAFEFLVEMRVKYFGTNSSEAGMKKT